MSSSRHWLLWVASRSSTGWPWLARCSRADWQYGHPGLTYMIVPTAPLRSAGLADLVGVAAGPVLLGLLPGVVVLRLVGRAGPAHDEHGVPPPLNAGRAHGQRPGAVARELPQDVVAVPPAARIAGAGAIGIEAAVAVVEHPGLVGQR